MQRRSKTKFKHQILKNATEKFGQIRKKSGFGTELKKSGFSCSKVRKATAFSKPVVIKVLPDCQVSVI